MKGIKTMELDVCKANIMASPTLFEAFAGTVELDSTFIKQKKSENHQMNVLEVSYSKNRQGGDRNYSGKRGYSGTSNSNQGSPINAAVDYRFYENHEYLAFNSDHNNTLHLKRVKRGHLEGRCRRLPGNLPGNWNYPRLGIMYPITR
jgi:hypothetical protein